MTDLLQIGELARRTGLSTRTLRHWDEIGLLKPSERSLGDYRLYSEADISRLLAISQLKSLGLALPEIAKALDDPAFDPGIVFDQQIAALQQRIEAEHATLNRLKLIRDRGPSGWEQVLETIASLERLAHPDAQVRFRALLDHGPKLEVADVVPLLEDPDPGVREGAAWAIVGQARPTEEIIAELIDGATQERHSLAHVLGKLLDPAGIATLRLLLADESVEVAAKAAFSLGQIRHPTARDALLFALSDTREQVGDEVVRALAKQDCSTELIEQLSSESSAVRLRATEVLALNPTAAAAGRLADLFRQDPSVEVQFSALLALGTLTGPAAESAITEASHSKSDQIRLLAVRLLADRAAQH